MLEFLWQHRHSTHSSFSANRTAIGRFMSGGIPPLLSRPKVGYATQSPAVPLWLNLFDLAVIPAARRHLRKVRLGLTENSLRLRIRNSVGLEVGSNSSMSTPAFNIWNAVDREEFMRLMGCSTSDLNELEAAGEVFSVPSPGNVGDRRYPAFQLSSDLDRTLLRNTLAMYREAGVSSTLLWSFLRSPQRESSNKTMVEIFLGALPPAEIGMSAAKRTEAILDIVAEELSRVR